MKITMEFNLPEDQEAFDEASQWQDVWCLIGSFNRYLSDIDRRKVEIDAKTPDEAVKLIRSVWITMMDDNDVRIG